MPIRFRTPIFRAAALLAFATALLSAASATAQPASSDVLRATLKNGLKVVIVRNTLAPVVSTSVNYLVGSDEAPAGFPGMAHAQEHMMFRGSPGLTAAQLADIGGMMGGDFNADTQEGVTQYLFTVPSEDIDVALHIGAIRMRDVDNSQKDWDKERGAIEQEVARDLSSPEYVLYKKLRATMFAGTPYAHDALGTRPSFDKTTAKMLKHFYEQWYAPNNAVLVIVGDLDPAKTLAKVRALYADIPARKLPARPNYRPQPVPTKSLTIPTDRSTGATIIALRMPGPQSADFAAVEVLADVLSSQRGALYAMVPKGEALGTGFEMSAMPKASLAYAVAAYPASTDAAKVKAAMVKILQGIRAHGVPPALVEAAKLQEKTQAGLQKDSIEGLASVWSEALTVYGLSSPDADLKRIEKVTVADVNRVARKYLDLDHAIYAVTVPRGSGKPVSGSGFGGQESIVLPKEKAAHLPAWAETALSRLSVPHSTVHPTVTTLPNGITLIVQPEDVSDTVSVYGHIKNREQTEAAANEQGVDDVLERLFDFGTQSMNRLQFRQALDAIGATESAGTDFSLQVPAQKFARGLELLADNELHPALPAPVMAIFQRQLAQVVAVRNQSPRFLADRALRKALFPATDPSLRDATAKSVSSLTLADLRAYYTKVFRPDETTIVVMGKITPKEAEAAVLRSFGAWKAVGPKPQTDLPAAPPNGRAIVAVPDHARVQDSVMLAETMGLTRSDPSYYALELGNAVLGGGFYSTRLSIDLRKNAGLVYTVDSSLIAGPNRGIYMIDYACDPKNVSRAAAIAIQDVAAMRKAAPSQDEMMRAKALLLRRIPLSQASFDGIAGGFIARRDLGLPLDEPRLAAAHYIAMTAGEVQAAFKKWIRPQDLVRISQGPAPQ